MVQNGLVQATKFVREIVQAKKKATPKDVENYVEMLKTFGLCDENLEYIRKKIEEHIQNKIRYFQRKQNKAKEKEYIKIELLTRKFWDYYLSTKKPPAK